MNKDEAIKAYEQALFDLDSARGEWVIVKQSQVKQEAEGFRYSEASTVTDRRNEAKFNSLDSTIELIDLEFKIKMLEDYCTFYGTIING